MTDYTELKRLAEAAESFKPTNRDLITLMYRAKPAYETHIHRQALVHRRALDQLLLTRLRGDLI